MQLIGRLIRCVPWSGSVATMALALCMAAPAWSAAAKHPLELARGQGQVSTSAWTPRTRDSLAAYLKQATGKAKATKSSIDGSQLQTWVDPKSGTVYWAFACEHNGKRRTVQIEHALRAFSGKQGDEQTIYAYVQSQCSGPTVKAETPRSAAATPAANLEERINSGEIEEVLYAWYLTYAGTLMQFKESVFVLLTNGTGIENPALALSEIHPDKHQAQHPKRWFHWRKAPGGYQIRPLKGGSWKNIRSDEPPKSVRPVAPDTRYSGELSGVASAGSLGGTHSANWRYFTFGSNGRYERKTSSLRGSDGMHNDSASGTYASTCDKDGRQSAGTTTIGGVSISTRSTKDGCGTALTGRYEIDGYRITLRGDDGSIERLSFFEISNGPHESEANKRKYSLMIGGAGYGTKDR